MGTDYEKAIKAARRLRQCQRGITPVVVYQFPKLPITAKYLRSLDEIEVVTAFLRLVKDLPSDAKS